MLKTMTIFKVNRNLVLVFTHIANAVVTCFDLMCVRRSQMNVLFLFANINCHALLMMLRKAEAVFYQLKLIASAFLLRSILIY